ncbi:hypothetical protein BPOR_0690g00030 [Botrytis porri]|uniref:Uncharacterized protein n=1 Tax=Botrytis porri TaxID=87229 RepID=A0A4Z1KAV6_9HELO|nr:hypothetical protein BPOR_0690g00030 [Botrytis porri]
MSQPFILTLRLDASSEKLLTALRTRYFPSSRNYLSAHIHEELLGEFREKGVQLTEQDDRKVRPHVTVQNKVEEGEAKRTLEEMKREWMMNGDGNGGIGGMAEAITLWRYEVSGEWTHLEDYEFA